MKRKDKEENKRGGGGETVQGKGVRRERERECMYKCVCGPGKRSKEWDEDQVSDLRWSSDDFVFTHTKKVCVCV